MTIHLSQQVASILFPFLLSLSYMGYASESCQLTKAYKDARYDTYTKISKPYNQCKNTMKEAYYWKAVAHCKLSLENNKNKTSCGQQVDSGNYPAEKIDLSHCETFKWKQEDITNYLDQLVNAGTLLMCKE